MESIYIYKSPSGLMYHLRPVSLLIFCLDDLFVNGSGMFKSLTIIVLLSVSPFMSVNICFMYLSAALLGTCTSTVVKSFSWVLP